MPGIVGIITQRQPAECQRLVECMVSSMEHEPFYDSGIHFVPEMGIYGGWVAHKNSFAARQVFFNERTDIALLFSGECFVDSKTRGELIGKGHELGEAAGSWLVHLYEEEDNRFFEKLNGLFSGLLIDKRRKQAFLFNDRYGVERIYWHETKDGFYFASEAKALLRILPELRAFDDEGVAQFLTFGCTLESRTLFRGVQLLRGGTLWSFESGKWHKRNYFVPSTWESQSTLTAEAFEAQFEETFKRVLPRYFESESKVGISLTGGLDTRMIMACRPAGQTPVCYTFAGKDGEPLDARLAVQVAKASGLDHRILRIGENFFSNFQSLADRTVYATDGCFGILGAHEIYLNAQARRLAPVRLTGVFGSEILRGVSTFKSIGLSRQLINPEFRREVNSLGGQLANGAVHPVSFAAFREIPWNIFGSLAACRSQVTFRTPYLNNEIVALAFRVPESLRQSPLIASRFVKDNDSVLGNIPTDLGHLGESKGLGYMLERVFAEATFKLDYHYSEGLPHSLSLLEPLFDRLHSRVGLLGRHKYLPYRHWFRRELAGYLNDVFEDPRIRQSPFWNSDFVNHMSSEHIAGRKNYVREINAVLTLQAVERLLIQS